MLESERRGRILALPFAGYLIIKVLVTIFMSKSPNQD